MSHLQESNRGVRSVCTECSLSELNQIIREAEESDEKGIQLLARPRTFFYERGFCFPPGARITITPTEELRARLLTRDGLKRFITEEQQGVETTKIKMHIKNGLAKCARVEFE